MADLSPLFLSEEQDWTLAFPFDDSFLQPSPDSPLNSTIVDDQQPDSSLTDLNSFNSIQFNPPLSSPVPPATTDLETALCSPISSPQKIQTFTGLNPLVKITPLPEVSSIYSYHYPNIKYSAPRTTLKQREREIYLIPDPVGFPTSGLKSYVSKARFKLPASRSPVIEAFVVCALNGWGAQVAQYIRLVQPAHIVFKVTNFTLLLKTSCAICSKQNQTEDESSRVKALRKWFVKFPKKKDRCSGAFFLTVKPAIAHKVSGIIEDHMGSRRINLILKV